jgi:SAM-dependent methyltransferase
VGGARAGTVLIIMGLDINSALFLISARKQGVNFGDVLMLGRQELNVYPAKMAKELDRNGLPTGPFPKAGRECAWAEPLFEALGAKTISALDASDFEGARLVHDLNQPVKPEFRERFDVVFDGGTLEHVFNFPVALKNCMEMLRINGRLFIHNCANNLCGHGFYQFSPELFFRALSPENGFEVERIYVHVVGPYGRWHQVADPHDVGSRVLLLTATPIQILVQAKRTAVKSIFAQFPFQSDYGRMWENHIVGKPEGAVSNEQPAYGFTARHFPGIRRFAHGMRMAFKFYAGQSLHNRRFYRPVKKP